MQTLELTVLERVALIRLLNMKSGPKTWDETKKYYKIIEKVEFTSEEKAMKDEELDALPMVPREFSAEQMTFICSTFEEQRDKFDASIGKGIISLADKLGYGDTPAK